MRNFNESHCGNEAEVFFATEALQMCEACGKHTSEILTYDPAFEMMECPACLVSLAEILAAEGVAVIPLCGNCGRTGERLFRLAGLGYLACDDCAGEARHVEEETINILAPFCPEQVGIVNSAQSVGQLANGLRAHQLIECVHCTSTRKTVLEDRLYLSTAAVCCEGKVA
jgi:hypothetical protein